VFALLRANAIRRIPVVRGQEFVGMITIDDLLVGLAADLADLAKPITAEVLFAHRESPVPATS
jgi:CBS domain-containing protein